MTVYGGSSVKETSATAFLIQDSSGTDLLTADTSTMTLTVKAVVITVSLTVNGHIITGNSSGSTTATLDANAGSGGSPSCTVSGNDTSGQITLTTGTSGWAVGTLCTINFAGSYTGTAPRPVITPANGSAASVSQVLYVDVPGASPFTTFTLNTSVAPVAQDTYKFNYFNVQ